MEVRFEGDSGVDIALHTIDAVFPEGEKRTIVLRLGAPFRLPHGGSQDEWWIRAELENLDSTIGPLAGTGSLGALVVGVRWIVRRLEIFEKTHGCRYFWASSNDEFDYRKFFS